MRLARLIPSILLAAAMAPIALAQHTHLPTPSTWTLNVKASNFGGGPVMKSDVFVMISDTEKWAKYTDTMIDGAGKTWKSTWSGPADGTPRPIEGMPGTTFQSSAATDISVLKMADGTTLTCKFSLTPDKKKFIEKCNDVASDGEKIDQTLVYDRTK